MRILKLSRAGWLGRLCARATTRLARGAFTESGQSYDATFEAVAHGHSILERNSGFIAVYHPDGVHSLLMTLYTRDGNQPRFRAKGFWRKSRVDHVRVPGHY